MTLKTRLLVGCGILATLGALDVGCVNRKNYEPFQVFVDLNGDSNPEYAYLVNTYADANNDGYYDFDVLVKEGSGNSNFGEPRSVHRFNRRPEMVKFEDVTGDRNPDLVYLLITNKDADDNGYYDFDLKMRPNDGQGNFGQEKLVQKFGKRPDGF